jgi:allophanate hydrolase subunit 2
MADAQTTGGYPIIASVISADLPLAAQLMPGDRVRFMQVTPESANQAARSRQADVDLLRRPEDAAWAPI